VTKGYLEKEGAPPSVPKEKEEKPAKGYKVGMALGMAVALGGLIAFEALLVWVILAYLLKAKFAYAQVLGSVLLFEYVLGRVMAKK